MSKIRSKYIETGDDFTFTGDVIVPNPSAAGHAANQTYVNDQIDQVSVFKSEELPYTDTVNKVIELSEESAFYQQVTAFIVNGSSMDYGIDYTVRNIGSTSYLCLSPDSTAPTASFDGGDASNPSVGVASYLLLNDVIKVLYATLGLGGGGTVPGPQGLLGARGFISFKFILRLKAFQV